MKTGVKIAVGTIAGFAVGCLIGMFIPSPETTEGTGKGDVFKVSKYNKNVVGARSSAYQERLMNDPEELKKTAASLSFLNSRMIEFDELVNLAANVSEGKEELSGILEELKSISSLSENARISSEQAVQSLDEITNGQQPKIDFEQASQRLALAMLMVERQINIGKRFVANVDTYLKGKDIDENQDLAMARDLWAGYCAGDAILNNDKEELAYWDKQQSLLPADALAAQMQIQTHTTTARPERKYILNDCESINAAVFEGAERMMPQVLQNVCGQTKLIEKKDAIGSVGLETMFNNVPGAQFISVVREYETALVNYAVQGFTQEKIEVR